MADAADIANDIEQERINRILSNRRATNRQVSAIECEECGDKIPEQRRLALPGVSTCVFCQELSEETAHWYGFPPHSQRYS